MKVLVVYASRSGSTKGIAEFIGEKLRARGLQADVQEVGAAGNLEARDAFVVGSAVYQSHWLKEATQFVKQNRSLLAGRPTWRFSSGPTGHEETDSKGRDLKEVSGPRELGDLREWVAPRDHRVFFGAFHRQNLRGPMGWFARWIPEDVEGDFRDWKEIESWVGQLAGALAAIPA